MPFIASAINLSNAQKIILESIVNSRTCRSDHRQRAKIILLCYQGLSSEKISQKVGLSRKQISVWRKRWSSHEERLSKVEIEKKSESIEYRRYILKLLSDQARSGAPPRFTSEQICKIYALATSLPRDCGLPLSQWSLSVLSKELVKRKIVSSISTSQLSVFLKSAGTQAT